jgi:ABC-type multidrug transport system fused ATPase/permease subunit
MPPISLLILYSSIAVSQFIALTEIRSAPRLENIPEIFGILTALIAIFTILCMPMRNCHLPNDHISPASGLPTSQLRSPEDNLTLLQFMTVSWMSPLISVGTARQLNDGDVWNLSYEFQHKALHESFRGLRGSVLRRLLVANGIDLVLISLLGLIELLGNSFSPVLLQQLLRSMEDPSAPQSAAITYAILSLIFRLVASQSAVFNLWFSRRSYERSRGELITMLSEKTLSRKMTLDGKPKERGHPKLANGIAKEDIQDPDPSNEPASMGKVLNLIRFDAYEVAQRFWEFQSLITQPLGVVISVILIWRLIGWPCLIGVLTVFFAQGINAMTARALLRWEKVRRVATDNKLQKISQFVEAIRHLRWYGWQDVWLGHIMEARQRELTLRVITSLWNILISFTNSFASGMFPVAAFYAYTTLAGKPLRIDVAFPALQLFSMLEFNLREIPGLITVLLNASVALGRIENFMNEPDKEENRALTDTRVPPITNTRLELKNASFAWPGADELVLCDISLSFPIGFTLVVGEVGAGKSALLQALLGELDQRGGEFLRPSEMFGYCAQTPWLQSMSIRENILFSSTYEESRYKEVLDVCALTTDMASFKHGDMSHIGENGIGLSGGQKARVALARAVYSRARILLLDDPLSALDSQTAETIVQKLFSRGRLLHGRVTILITHRTELCRGIADQVVEISGGRACLVDPEMISGGLTRILSPEETNEPNQTRDQEQQLDSTPDQALEDEHRSHGGVKASVYWEYIQAGKVRWWMVLIFVLAIYRLIDIGKTVFLKSWGEAYGPRSDTGDSLQPFSSISPSFEALPAPLERVALAPFAGLPSPETNIRLWLVGFFLLAAAQSVAFLISQGFMVVIIYTAGRRMFADVMTHVSHATFRFYDVTPVGRLLNRLTGDCSTIDGNISGQFQNVAQLLIDWISSIIVIMSVTPVFLIFAIALTVSFVLTFLRFLPTSQSLRRLEVRNFLPDDSSALRLTILDGVLEPVDVQLWRGISRTYNHSRFISFQQCQEVSLLTIRQLFVQKTTFRLVLLQ